MSCRKSDHHGTQDTQRRLTLYAQTGRDCFTAPSPSSTDLVAAGTLLGLFDRRPFVLQADFFGFAQAADCKIATNNATSGSFFVKSKHRHIRTIKDCELCVGHNWHHTIHFTQLANTGGSRQNANKFFCYCAGLVIYFVTSHHFGAAALQQAFPQTYDTCNFAYKLNGVVCNGNGHYITLHLFMSSLWS